MSPHRVILVALCGALFCPGASSVARETGSFSAPVLDGYTLSREFDGDGDGDGVEETRVRQYRNSAGDSVFYMSITHVRWAWSLDTHGDDDTDISSNFVIRDSNCDGVFDERYAIDEEFHVPACLQ